MPPLLLVMAGGAIGAGLRFLGNQLALRQLGPAFPYGTFAINLLGGLLMGVLVGVLARMDAGVDAPMRLFMGVGVLGGFTTFSAFSLEMFNMMERGQHLAAGSYAVASVVGSVLMVFAGIQLMRAAA